MEEQVKFRQSQCSIKSNNIIFFFFCGEWPWVQSHPHFVFFGLKQSGHFHILCLLILVCIHFRLCCISHLVQLVLTEPNQNMLTNDMQSNRLFVYWTEILHGKLWLQTSGYCNSRAVREHWTNNNILRQTSVWVSMRSHTLLSLPKVHHLTVTPCLALSGSYRCQHLDWTHNVRYFGLLPVD